MIVRDYDKKKQKTQHCYGIINWTQIKFSRFKIKSSDSLDYVGFRHSKKFEIFILNSKNFS